MKTREYHQDALRYNEEIARTAEKLSETLKNEEVAGWCAGIGRQHRFHAKRHKQALGRLKTMRKSRRRDQERDESQHELADNIIEGLTLSAVEDDMPVAVTGDIMKEQAEFAAAQKQENVA